MRIPVPKNRLVALTLLGIVLTTMVSVVLAAPALLTGPEAGGDGGAVADDAPAPNQDFTPAVKGAGGDEDDDEHEDDDDEEEEWEYDDVGPSVAYP